MTDVKRTKGISAETRTTTAPSFKPDMNVNDGLVLANIDWDLTKKVASDDSNQEGFRGLEVPSITFIFSEHGAKGKKAMYYHNFRPVDYSDVDIDVDMIEEANFSMLRHFIEEILGRELGEKDFPKLVLDIAENAKPSEVLAGYDKFYNGIIDVLSEVKDKSDKQVFWLKLLLYVKSASGKVSKVNNGNPGIGLFVGKGFIERFVQGVKPKLSINIGKGESIIPKDTTEANIPAGMGAIAGQVVPNADVVPEWAKQQPQG